MKISSLVILTFFGLLKLTSIAQTNLLEHIPTNEFAVVKFNGVSISEKSKGLEQLAISDSISNQFNRLLKKYKQVLIDENTTVSDAEVEKIIEEIEVRVPEDPQFPNDQLEESNFEGSQEAIDPPQLKTYNYENSNYYKVTPKITLDKLFMTLMSKGTDYGINNNSDYYFVVGMNDSINHNALLFSKSDAAKFEGFISSIIPQDQKNKLIKLKNSYEYFFDDDMLIGWNKDLVVFIDYSIPYRYDYKSYNETNKTEEEYYESYEERLAAEKLKKEAAKTRKIEGLLNNFFIIKPEHSLSKNSNYSKTKLEKGEVTFFMNALGNNASLYTNMFGARSMNSQNNNFLSLFKDNFSFGSLNFNEGEIVAKMKQHVGPKYLKDIKKMNSKKFNKSMYKYIDGNDLLGIAGFATRPKYAYNMYRDVYTSVFSSISPDEEWIGTAVDIAFTFFDEEELFNLVQGDFIFAVTDIKKFDMEYTTYDYDEDFNRVEKTETRQETLPEFVSIASIGNEELRAKIIKLMQQTDVISKKGHYYELQEPKSKYSERAAKPLNVFYMIKNDLLIVSNDENLMKSNNGNGLSKSNQINGDALKLMKSNNMFAYWTPKTTYDKAPSEFADELKPLKDIVDTYKSVQFTGVKNKGNIFTSTATINMEQSNKNSLMLSLDMIETMLKTAMRGN